MCFIVNPPRRSRRPRRRHRRRCFGDVLVAGVTVTNGVTTMAAAAAVGGGAQREGRRAGAQVCRAERGGLRVSCEPGAGVGTPNERQGQNQRSRQQRGSLKMLCTSVTASPHWMEWGRVAFRRRVWRSRPHNVTCAFRACSTHAPPSPGSQLHMHSIHDNRHSLMFAQVCSQLHTVQASCVIPSRPPHDNFVCVQRGWRHGGIAWEIRWCLKTHLQFW